MNKDEKLKITKDKLLDATFFLMENMEDPLSVTSREIAARANVQPAMINYCFGSRENLIYATFFKQYLSFLEDKEIGKIVSSGEPPKEIIKKLHFAVAGCLVDNHKFTKAITGYILFKRDLSQEAFSLHLVREHYKGRKTEEECKFISYELSTLMQLVIFRKDDFKKDFGIDLDNREELKHFIDMRVDLLLED